MKTIICDFKRSSLGVIGEENEHNAIELLFNLPKDFEAADYIHVEFDTMDGDPFARDTFEFNKEEMTLRGRLDQKVMKAGELKIQLVGYAIDEEGTIVEIAKSPVIKAIVGNSVNGIITEGDADPSMIEILKAKLDKLLEEGINVEGGGALPVAYINDDGELCFELSSGINDARINNKGELELVIETESGDKSFVLGKVKGRTPEFRLTEKILEIKYDDENTWSTLVDFSTIASTFDLRLNEENYFLEAQREVDGEWESMVDLSALKLAHEHKNKTILDKLTYELFTNVGDALNKKHSHSNMNALNNITDNFVNTLSQIGNEQINNIKELPSIKQSVETLENKPETQQLVKGFSGGFSANPDAIPTAYKAWIECDAASPLGGSREIKTKELKVTKMVSSDKTTTTDVSINITWYSSYGAQEYFRKIMDYYSHASIIFADETDKTYYIVLSKNNCSVTDATLSLQFTFPSGYDTFPITETITRAISTIKFYVAVGTYSHSEGSDSKAIGSSAHAEGYHTIATNQAAHAEGYVTEAKGYYSHAEGDHTIASGSAQHVQGKYNIEDTENKYAHIVGNGIKQDDGDIAPSNAHTLDWEGNAWYAGNVEGTSVIIKSSTPGSIKRFKIMVDDSGALTATEITG